MVVVRGLNGACSTLLAGRYRRSPAFWACSVAMMIVTVMAGAGGAWGVVGPGPSYRYCGSLHTRLTSDGKPVRVYAQHTSCRTAMTIQKALWTGPSNQRMVHNGSSEATSYILLQKYPGWVCRPGMGTDVCRKHGMTAAGLF